MPLILAGGAGGVLLLIIVLVVAFFGGNSGDSSDGEGESDDTSKVSVKDKDAYEKKKTDTLGSENPAAWVELGDMAAKAGRDDEAEAHYRKALDLQPDYTVAKQKLGYQTYQIPADLEEYSLEKPLPEALTEATGKMVSPEKLKDLRALEKEYKDAVTAELQRKTDDPFYAAVEQVKTAFLGRKGLNKYAFQVRRSEPYVVFEQIGMKGDAPEATDAGGERRSEEKLRMLHQLFKVMKTRWMTPFGLSMDPELPLIIIALKDRQAFDELHREMGMGVPKGALAYFHRIHTYIILYNGAFGGGGLAAKEYSDGVVFHEGTHQIINAFINKGKGFNSGGAIRIPFWVNEGMAEYMGGIEITGDTDADGFDIYKIGVPHKMRLGEFWRARQARRMGRMQIPPFYLPLHDLIECFDQDMIISRAKRILGDKVPMQVKDWIAQAAVSLVYAEASSFFLFCYEYQNGKYARAIDKYLRKCFSGYSQTKYFMEAFGVDNLDGLNKEWLDYVEEITPDRYKRG